METVASEHSHVEGDTETVLSRDGLAKFLVLAVQVGLVVLVIGQFEIQSRSFFHLSLLAAAGFLIHSFLPFRYRLPFFALLSLTGIGIVLGVKNGAWLVGAGLLLIGLCHLPFSWRARVGLVFATAVVLAALRAGWAEAPWPNAVWPILGSMFMFRLIIYLYDLKHEDAPASFWRTLSYFFVLPNVCFPLFPVVDYKVFRQTYHNGDQYWIWQRGVQWMLRGIVHLILYRFVYYYCTMEPSEVEGAAELAQCVVANFALYLRVSGIFHLAVGMLHLFGFNLPETHHRYFLASSINDFWRRINIYWKDFMLKVFFYPAFFRLRRYGVTQALALSTGFVVLVTWFLHAYQWFWIGGSFRLTWQDAAFWGILGLFMIANTTYENLHPRARGRRARSWTFQGAVGQALQIGVTFSIICVLWSMWTSESFEEWVGLWSVLWESTPTDLARGSLKSPTVLSACFLSLIAIGSGGGSGRKGEAPRSVRQRHSLWRTAGITGSVLAILYVAGMPAVYLRLDGKISDIMHSLRSLELNRLDVETLQRGYYEDLLNENRIDSQLREVYTTRPKDWDRSIKMTTAARMTDDFLEFELVPGPAIIFRHSPLHVNQWGMRDQEYTQAKPPGTYRIALLGASYVMGSGVANNETFEALVEDRLNREGPKDGVQRYEILNLAVDGYSPFQRWMIMERKAFQFDPDAVFYVAHGPELLSLTRHLLRVLPEGAWPPDLRLRQMLWEANIRPGVPRRILMRRIRRRGMDLLERVYGRIVEQCRERNILPVWIYLPTIAGYGRNPNEPDLTKVAERAGFIILSLARVFDGYDLSEVRIATWDRHPNASGHALIAEKLYAELTKLDRAMPFFSKDATSAAGTNP